MFGWKSHLPIDLIFGTNAADLKGYSIAYVENPKRRIEWGYQTANEVIKKRAGEKQAMI